MDSTATIPQRSTHNDSDQLEELDIESILRRSRNVGRTRRRKPMCEAPEFIQRLNPFNEVEIGDNIVFECQCLSFPQPNIKWYKDDIEITDNQRMQMTTDTKGNITMMIAHAQKEDEGTYRCKAENEEGIASTTGYVTITGDEPDKPLSSNSRDRNPDHVSLPPHLRTIQEQKTLEESETVEYGKMSPSPIRAFNEGRRIRKKSCPSFNSSLSDSESDNTSVDSQDFNHVMEDLTLDLEDAERSRLAKEKSDDVFINGDISKSTPTTAEPVINDISTSSTCTNNDDSKRDRVPSAQALSSMFTTFVGDDVTYSMTEIDGHKIVKAVSLSPQGSVEENILQKQKSKCSTPSTSTENISVPVLSQETKASSVDSGYSGGNSTSHPQTSTNQPEPSHSGFENQRKVETSQNDQTQVKIKKQDSVLEEVIMDFPWLYFGGLSSTATFIASCTNMSPVLFVILVAIISFLSFGTLVKYKKHVNQNN